MMIRIRTAKKKATPLLTTHLMMEIPRLTATTPSTEEEIMTEVDTQETSLREKMVTMVLMSQKRLRGTLATETRCPESSARLKK